MVVCSIEYIVLKCELKRGSKFTLSSTRLHERVSLKVPSMWKNFEKYDDGSMIRVYYCNLLKI